MSNVGNSRPKIKKYSKVFSIHKKAYTIAESFLRSTQFKDDLQKLSSDPPKLDGSQEAFLRSTQFGLISESFRLISCWAASVLSWGGSMEIVGRTSELKAAHVDAHRWED